MTKPSRDGSVLCLQCGMCCNGSVYDRGELTSAETDSIRALGLDVEQEGDRAFFALPCPKFQSGGCTVYEQRPATCRRYTCTLLQRYLDDDIEPQAALGIIERAKQLVAEVRKTLPADGSLRTARRRWREEGQNWASLYPDAAAKAEAGRRRLAITMLDQYLDRYFFTDRDREERGAK